MRTPPQSSRRWPRDLLQDAPVTDRVAVLVGEQLRFGQFKQFQGSLIRTVVHVDGLEAKVHEQSQTPRQWR